jgi:ribose transport system ATP-binding protein
VARDQTDPPAVLEAAGLSKTFGDRTVLRDVGLRVMPGEIHALVGQNGSGKSTLIKILAGYHAPDEGGSLWVRGRRVTLPIGPGEGARVGLAFVHQDLGLVDGATVTENLRLTRYETRAGWMVNWREERRRTGQALARFGLAISPDAVVSSLTAVQRALVAILRALDQLGESDEGAMLVLDEPTAYLPRDGIDQLFEAVREVAGSGIGVMFVSHRLEEVFALTDTVSVLRDGNLVTTAPTKTFDESSLVREILGSTLADLYPSEHQAGTKVAADVTGLTVKGLDDFQLQLKEGEIVGLTGLLGMGWERVPYLVFGAERAAGGTLRIDGRHWNLRDLSPHDARAAGVALIPGDRQRAGVVPDATVRENVTLATLGEYFDRATLRHGRERVGAVELLEQFAVSPADPENAMANLSGGNQQKVLVAKWFARSPRVVFMHEPTQGVDIGARRGIFLKIREIAETGAPLVIASSEYQDLARLCHRVLVFRDGRVVSELSGSQLSERGIAEQCFKTSETGTPAG